MLVLCIYANSLAQELVLKHTIDGKFDYMTSDHIGRLYLAKGHELFLYSEEGKLLYQFSDLSRGRITCLDTRNPMKLLLFYPDYGEIALLDNTLSRTRQNINLNTLDLSLAQLACASFDNGFWVYDPVNFKLIRFDQGLNITNEVSSINQLVGSEINPTQMVEFDSWLYVNDPNFGVFIFDSFGTYSKLLPITNAQRIHVKTNGIFFEIGNKLIKYDPLSFDQMEITLPTSNYKQLGIEKNRLYVMQDNRVLMYQRGK